MWWTNTVCATLRTPGPMAQSRTAATSADGLAADPLFCDLVADLPLHLKREADFETVVEIKDLRLSGF